MKYKKPEGRKRVHKVSIRLNEQEYEKMINDVNKMQSTKSKYFRLLILNARICEKPDIEFYKALNQIAKFGVILNQIAKKANSINVIDKVEYQKLARDWQSFMKDIKIKYLGQDPEEIERG